ncbi:hypothetical protein FHG87_020737, partial [Trinorchestia longiramus]
MDFIELFCLSGRPPDPDFCYPVLRKPDTPPSPRLVHELKQKNIARRRGRQKRQNRLKEFRKHEQKTKQKISKMSELTVVFSKD